MDHPIRKKRLEVAVGAGGRLSKYDCVVAPFTQFEGSDAAVLVSQQFHRHGQQKAAHPSLMVVQDLQGDLDELQQSVMIHFHSA